MVPTKPTSTTPAKRALTPGGPRDTRADRARAEEMAVVPVGGGIYDVVTESDHVYTVDLQESRCTCPDYKHRQARCKHLRRVAMEVTEGRVPPPGKREADCSSCDRSFYADESETGPVYCESCTLGPGDLVVDRERENLLVVVRTTDERARDVAVPGTQFTVADYPTNREYDPEDRVVEIVYPIRSDVDPDDIRASDIRRYSFPRGRLERRWKVREN